MRTRPVLIAGLAAVSLAFAFAGCGDDDDGEGVREVGEESGSGSASGSGSGSGSGSASGSGSGSGHGAGTECVPVGDLATATTTLDVTTTEFEFELSADSVPAGSVGIVAQNDGAEPHEVVVIAGVAPDDLPLDDDGALDEAGLPDGALIGEIEPWPAGESCSGVFDLAPGEYTLACNIVEEEDGETESHLHEGMVTTLTVT